jgi:hypothetical protein
MRKACLIAAAALLLTTSCSNDNPAGPSSGPGGNGSMTARIDGVLFTATSVSADNTRGLATPYGTDGNQQIEVAFGPVAAGTTYTVGQPNILIIYRTLAGNPQLTWQAGGTTGSGTITCATSTATRVAGTFSGTLVGPTGTKQITDGQFNITY